MSDEEHAKFDPWIVEQLTVDLAQARTVAHEQREEILALNETRVGLHHVLDKCIAGVETLREQLAQARAEHAEARAALVTEETAALMEWLANNILHTSNCPEPENMHGRDARALAARIREALEADND